MENILVSSTATELRIESGADKENGSNKTNPIGEGKKIQFHLATKDYSGLSNGKGSSNGDFWIETLNPDTRKRPFGFDHRPVQGQGQTGKRVDGSDFGESGLDPELCFGITFRRIGAGLENLGNTCFLNSVVQCLTYTEPLAAYLQSGKHQNSCHVAGFCALCAIQKHVSRALQSTGRSLVPKDLVSNLRCISRNFRNARQEDAHEYMVNLLESMHKCCLPSGVPSESPAAYEKSLVHKIFGGRLRSQVQCQQCLYCSNKFDPFLDLSLEIAKTDTLPAALRNFTAPEMLDGGEKHYQCQRCKQKVKAKKWLTVDKAPYVLTIHLKRFHAHDPLRKVDRKVIFDRSLDMKPFVSGSHEEDLKYSLYGVLVHFGHNTHSGHYVCFVRTSGGMWYYLNDNEVRQVSEKAVLEQKAYMLFYVRDRKNIASRKPAVVQKENLKGAMSSDIANLVAKQLSKECVDNGLIVSGVEATNSSATVDRNGASSVVTSLEIHPKDTSLQQNNRQPLQKCSMQKVDLVLESSTVLSKDPSEGAASGNLDLGDSLPPSAPSLNSDTVASELESASVVSGAKISDCNEPSSSSGGPEKSTNDKLVTDQTSQKINVDLKGGASCQMPWGDSSDEKAWNFPRLSPSVESSDKALDKTDTEKSFDKPSCESNQGGRIPNECAAGETSSDKAADSGRGIVHPPAEPSIPITSVIPNGCSHSKARDCAPKKKLKKKLLRCRAHLGSPFFKISLAIHKRKKHKKSKSCSSETKNLMLEQLENDGLSSDLGPSTSRMSSTVLVAPKSSRRKVAKTDSRKGENMKKCSESRMDVVGGEFVSRNNQNKAVPAMDKHVQKSSTSISEVSQWDAREHDSTEKGKICASQNGMMSALTWGLEGTTVARWDGIELPSQIVESNSGENHSIGYVPDEWDEEYDRGKRKKIRQSKLDFGGPNPFQEIATKKTQIKKAKMDRSSSGNQPFRI